MESLYLLVPLALVIAAGIVWLFLWAVKSDQFEDLEGPAHRIIMEDDDKVKEKTDDGSSDNKQ